MSKATPTCFELGLEVVPGAAIEECAQKAQQLADQLGVFVRFHFNTVICTATPGGSPERLVSETFHAMGRDDLVPRVVWS